MIKAAIDRVLSRSNSLRATLFSDSAKRQAIFIVLCMKLMAEFGK